MGTANYIAVVLIQVLPIHSYTIVGVTANCGFTRTLQSSKEVALCVFVEKEARTGILEDRYATKQDSRDSVLVQSGFANLGK